MHSFPMNRELHEFMLICGFIIDFDTITSVDWLAVIQIMSFHRDSFLYEMSFIFLGCS